MPGKACRHCRVHKPFDQFGNHPTTVDRLQSWCKACVRDAVRQWRSNPDNRRRERERAAEKRAAKRAAKLL